MNVTTATAYLEEIEHADPRAAKNTARVLVTLAESNWFFRAWWCQALEPCLAISPQMTGRPDTVVARLGHHFGFRITAAAPLCHTCARPLHLADVQVTMPNGHCRTCNAARPAVPAPREASSPAAGVFVTPSTASRNGGGGR